MSESAKEPLEKGLANRQHRPVINFHPQLRSADYRGAVLGFTRGIEGASVVDHTLLAGAERLVPAPTSSTAELWQLASDFDRWGLAPEAELARLRYRQKLVQTLLEGGLKTASPPAPREP